MPRPLTAVAAAGVAAFACIALSATATGAPRVAAPCTLLAAKSGILSSSLPMRLKHDAAGREGSGIDRLICRDLTRDGRKDMVASVFSKARGVEAWVFFRAASSGWRLSFRRTGLVAAQVEVAAEGRGGDRSQSSGPVTHGRAVRAAGRSTTASSGGAGRWPRFALGIPAPPRHRIPRMRRALPAIVVVLVAGCGGSKKTPQLTTGLPHTPTLVSGERQSRPPPQTPFQARLD